MKKSFTFRHQSGFHHDIQYSTVFVLYGLFLCILIDSVRSLTLQSTCVVDWVDWVYSLKEIYQSLVQWPSCVKHQEGKCSLTTSKLVSVCLLSLPAGCASGKDKSAGTHCDWLRSTITICKQLMLLATNGSCVFRHILCILCLEPMTRHLNGIAFIRGRTQAG